MADRTKTISASFAVRYVASDATFYNLVLSSDTIKKDSGGNALTALTASVQYIVGATLTEYTTAAELSAAGITITYSANSLADNIFGAGVSVSTTALSEIEAYVGVQMYVNGSVYTSKKVFIVQDGADGGGEDAIVMAISNSASVVLCQEDGTVIDETDGYETTTAYMYDGTTDVTDDTTFAISSTSGITATISGNVISVSDITEDNAGVQIKGTYNGNVRYSYYSVKKLCAGADATFYRLIVGMSNIPCDSDGAVTISTIPLTVQKVQGDTITNLTDYSDVEDEGLNITADLTSTDNEISKGYYINNMDCPIASMVLSEEEWTGTFASVTFYLHPSSVTYNSGSDYDYQTINAMRDGTAGTAGANAVQFYFTPSLILHKVSSSSTTYSVTISATEGVTALAAGAGNGTFSAEPTSLPTGTALATSAASGTSVTHTFVVSASAEPSGTIMFALDATTSDGETISKTQSLYIETVADGEGGTDGEDGEDALQYVITPTIDYIHQDTDGEVASEDMPYIYITKTEGQTQTLLTTYSEISSEGLTLTCIKDSGTETAFSESNLLFSDCQDLSANAVFNLYLDGSIISSKTITCVKDGVTEASSIISTLTEKLQETIEQYNSLIEAIQSASSYSDLLTAVKNMAVIDSSELQLSTD